MRPLTASARVGVPAGRHADQLAAWAGRIVTLGALWSLLSFPLRGMRWPDLVDDALGLVNVPVGASLFLVVSLALLGSAMRRRLRAAWLLALGWELFAAALSATVLVIVVAHWDSLRTDNLGLTRLDGVLAVISLGAGIVLAAVLWTCRSAFPARLAAGSRLASLTVLVGGLAASTAITILLTQAFPHTLHGAGERIGWAVRSAFGDSTDRGLNGHSGHHWIAVLAGVLSAVSVLAAAGVFLRSARAKQYLGAADELAVRRLLLDTGERDSLGYFATRRDKSVIFSPDGRAAVTYRVLASVSLASADPIGHPASWPAAIAAWQSEARAHGWFPAVLAASESGANAYVAAGLKALTLGDEAVIDVDEFRLDGHAMRPVRQAVTRIRRAGYTVRTRRHADIDAAELATLSRLAEQWRGNATERGFSMALNRLGDPADDRAVMVTAHDRSGSVRGLLSFVPWGARGLSLDLMRRDRAAENGLIEFMVTALMHTAPELGVRRVSLNFAMFRSVFSSNERVGAGPILRLTVAALGFASRFWQIETLYRSNAKYLPHWVPRFLCFDSSLTLTRAAIAAGMAEGFLPAPRPRSPRAAADTVSADSVANLGSDGHSPGGGSIAFADAVRALEAERLRPPRPLHPMPQQHRVRRGKIARLAEAGQAAYPVGVPRTTRIADVLAAYPELAAGSRTGHQVSVTGRVRALRDLGGVGFAVVQEDGASVQVMLTVSDTPLAAMRLWKQAVDLGDLVSVTGEVSASKSGELSVLVQSWQMAAKCLRPLPDARAGFADPDARVRQRYLDLIVNRDSLALLRTRSTVVHTLRTGLRTRGFTEVETPMLQAVHGGATARPFRTHINAYDTDLYLRIAPELYLKRLCVGGMDAIFELNRNFRNEGADASHNPEFTSLEAYLAYADYTTMRELTEDLIRQAAVAVHGDAVIPRDTPDGVHPVRLEGPWPVQTVHAAVGAACGGAITVDTSAAELRELCRAQGVHHRADASAGELVLELYEALVEKRTQTPTFYVDFPIETSPLTRPHRHDPRLAERWDLVAFGMEIGTAYSELIDPIDQRERLTEQSLRAASGDPEAMQVDESFLTALEYAMPPTGGLGLGVDRLVMMLTGASIRATLAFPFVRPT